MIDFMNQLFEKFGNVLINVLPKSPFQPFLASIEVNHKYVEWLNWFVPVNGIITVIQAWLLAIAGFYVYKAVAHWIGVIS